MNRVSQKLEGGKVFSDVKHLKSPMPGTIRERYWFLWAIHLKKGDQICLLESMKMQQVIRAGADGKVEDIKISWVNPYWTGCYFELCLICINSRVFYADKNHDSFYRKFFYLTLTPNHPKPFELY
ncbi:MAG: hypothetical protein CM1200mP3_07590 [Chloroflexota bacterium]|nr:MAG: hypothetical protein CM1200mP3_07590 [Chloroflexota bacterium]